VGAAVAGGVVEVGSGEEVKVGDGRGVVWAGAEVGLGRGAEPGPLDVGVGCAMRGKLQAICAANSKARMQKMGKRFIKELLRIG
jgi:hypothetical protein